MTMLKFEDFFMTYGDAQYAELGVFIDLLRALSLLHQTHHWQTQGPQFYGDHLLYQRLYELADGQIDGVGEKAVGLGSTELVLARHSLENMRRFIEAVEDSADVMDAPALKMAKRSLLAEKSFITAGEKLMNQLKSKGLLTRGVEQLLGTILDTHEGVLYLLKQRVAGA
jgi:DNA-binding ferritin-like protein